MFVGGCLNYVDVFFRVRVAVWNKTKSIRLSSILLFYVSYQTWLYNQEATAKQVSVIRVEVVGRS